MKHGAFFAPIVALSLAACGNSNPLGGNGVLGTQADAARFLTQATFGPTTEDIDALAAGGSYDAWMQAQKAAPMNLELPYLRSQNKAITQTDRTEAWWRFAITGEDQLRQRMAFALSEIMVISTQSVLAVQPEGMAYYYDLLIGDSLGNFRDLLTDVTLAPAMGNFLSMFRNQKPNADFGIRSDENYAREVMQLFTIGLVQLNPDGTPKLDGDGRAMPTFSQSDVANLARVFTGWSWAGGDAEDDFNNTSGSWTEPMQAYESYHDSNAKVILNNTPVPAGMRARPELDLALDVLFAHPNVGPFIGRQLIQRMVTSNPSPAYVARVAAAFDNNGQGVRGDLFAVARAILLDPEARREPDHAHDGKLREPILRLSHVWRAFHASADNGRYDYSLARSSFAQSPLDAPSVFNFFRPDFRPVGEIARADRVAPEFGITDETTIVNGTNELRRVAGFYRSSAGPTSSNPSDILLDYQPFEAKASDPAALLDELSLLLMSGRMPAAMKQSLVEFAGTIPEDKPAQRVNELIHLIITSPQAATQL